MLRDALVSEIGLSLKCLIWNLLVELPQDFRFLGQFLLGNLILLLHVLDATVSLLAIRNFLPLCGSLELFDLVIAKTCEIIVCLKFDVNLLEGLYLVVFCDLQINNFIILFANVFQTFNIVDIR